ncbi:MAG: GNAT family N-acetyltransferase [Vicinamibacterales bacterium]
MTTSAGFDALENDWRDLHDRAEGSIFQSFEWQRTWWECLRENRPGASLRIVLFRSDGRVAGIAPFFVQQQTELAVLNVRTLAFIGQGASDYLDVLVLPGHQAQGSRALARALADLWPSLDVVELAEIPERSTTLQLLIDELLSRGIVAGRTPAAPCPRLLLKSSWQETVATLAGRHRRQLQKKERELTSAFQVELEVVERGGSIGDDVRQFIEMHQRRWNETGADGALSDPATQRLLARAAERFSERGWLFLAFLRLNGRRAVANLCFVQRDTMLFYLSGTSAHADAARASSPGLVLHALCMRAAIDRGIRVYDFLRGGERYKYELGAVDAQNWTIGVRRRRELAIRSAGRAVARLQRAVHGGAA